MLKATLLFSLTFLAPPILFFYSATWPTAPTNSARALKVAEKNMQQHQNFGMLKVRLSVIFLPR